MRKEGALSLNGDAMSELEKKREEAWYDGVVTVRLCLRAFVFAIAVFFPLWSYAVPAPFVLNDNFSGKPLGFHLEYFIDESAQLVLKDILRDDIALQFLPVNKEYPSFGYSRSAFWLRMKVHNPSPHIRKWILEYNYPIIDLVEVFLPGPGGYIRHQGGDSVPFSSREIRCRSIAFPVTQPPGESYIYLRVKSGGSITIPLEAHDPEDFSWRIQLELALLFLHYGIMFALFIYNLFIFLSYREKSYLFLSLFLGAITFFSMAQNGISFQFLWPNAIRWSNISNPFFLFLSIVFSIAFSRTFLRMKSEIPRIDAFGRYFMYLNALLLAFPFFGDYHIATQLSTAFAGIAVLFFIVSGSFLLYRKDRAAIFLMFAWSAFIVGAALTALRAFGLTTSGMISMWGYQAGVSIMALLLSFGVADQLKRLREEREKALTALKDSEEKYRALVENAREGILLIVDGAVRYANRSFIEMTGYSENELYSLNVFKQLFPPQIDGTNPVHSNYLSRIKGNAAPDQYEARIKSKDGRDVDVFISAVAISVEGKTGTLSIVTNISTLKKAEKTILQQYEEIHSQYEELEALNEELVNTQNELLEANDSLAKEREKLSITLRSIADSVVTTDVSGTIAYMNPSAEKLIGIPLEKAEGKWFPHVFSLKGIHSGADVADPVRKIIADGHLENTEILLNVPGKDPIVVELSGATLKNKSGNITGTVMALRDITARQKLEQEISKINRLESLGVLAGGIAHDFNNLLTAILANASLLKTRKTIDEKFNRMISMIEKAGERAANLTRQLLTFARGGDPVKKSASIMALLRESIELTQTGSNCLCEIVTVTPEAELWPLRIDPGQISQVFNNLLINAIQAMPSGGKITVMISNSNAPEGLLLKDGRYVRVDFIDEGEGIPLENIGKIFDPYFTTKDRGYGLGLATCYSIIKKHDGYIHVQSRPGSGSTFTVYLPSCAVAEKDEVQKKSNTSGVQKYRVLLMDDEEYVLQSLSSILESFGHECDTARDGREAIEKFKAALRAGKPFDIVIMDLTVPGGMGGKDAAVEFGTMKPRPVLIVSSGYSSDPVLARPADYGFDGVILKPYSSDDVIMAIETVMAGKMK